MKRYIIILSLLLLFGCANSRRINRIKLDMPRDEVIDLMGSPTSISAARGVEYLHYKLSETSDDAFRGVSTPYFIRIIDNKVESFGRMGDFDSEKTPTIRIETDENIKIK